MSTTPTPQNVAGLPFWERYNLARNPSTSAATLEAFNTAAQSKGLTLVDYLKSLEG